MKAPPVDGRAACLLLALIIGSLLLFGGSMYGGFIWDDLLLISNNPRLGDQDYLWQAIRHPFPYASSLLNWHEGMYRPVVSAAYGIEYRLFGENTVGYHLVNLGLNTTCMALLFFWLRRRLLRDEPRGAVPVAAAWGTALFAAHPSHAESVAWISGSTDLWAAMWGLAALTVWDRVRGLTGAALSAVCFTLSFYSKETGLMLPIALLVDTLIRGGSPAGERQGRRGGVVAIVLAAALLLRHQIMSGTPSPEFNGVGHRIFAVLATFGGYLRLALWPWPPSTQVGYVAAVVSGTRSYPPLYAALGVAGLAGLLSLALAAWRRPACRPWLADAVWFVAPLIPVLNFVEANPEYFLYERSLYLSAMGWAAAGARMCMRLEHRSLRLRRVMAGGAGLLLAAYAAGASFHALHFISASTLWSYEARIGGFNSHVAENLAAALTSEHRYGEAKEAARKGLKHSVTGRALELMNEWMRADFQQAQTQGAEAIARVRRYHDEIATGAEPEGEIRAAWGDLDPAAREWLRRSVYLLVRRARTAIALGDFDAAVQELTAAQSSSTGPDDPIVPALIVALVGRGSVDEAARRLALPGAALSAAKDRLGKLIEDARRAADPNLPPIKRENQLSGALVAAGEWSAAIAVVNRALSATSAVTDQDRIPLLLDRLTGEAFLSCEGGLTRDAETLRRLDPKLGPELAEIVNRGSP